MISLYFPIFLYFSGFLLLSSHFSRSPDNIRQDDPAGQHLGLEAPVCNDRRHLARFFLFGRRLFLLLFSITLRQTYGR